VQPANERGIADAVGATTRQPTAEAAKRRLINLGYSQGETPEDNIKAFQRDYGRTETGKLEDITDILIPFHDDVNPQPRGTPVAKTTTPPSQNAV
jgi:hypothetical protein